mmetsp:Transcript_45422/g.81709  ORF Transcript_45422/g.81709 Transcript_45422/m.81709 type:complete len:351 (-) Transcript_45422:2154-3206(-)
MLSRPPSCQLESGLDEAIDFPMHEVPVHQLIIDVNNVRIAKQGCISEPEIWEEDMFILAILQSASYVRTSRAFGISVDFLSKPHLEVRQLLHIQPVLVPQDIAQLLLLFRFVASWIEDWLERPKFERHGQRIDLLSLFLLHANETFHAFHLRLSLCFPSSCQIFSTILGCLFLVHLLRLACLDGKAHALPDFLLLILVGVLRVHARVPRTRIQLVQALPTFANEFALLAKLVAQHVDRLLRHSDSDEWLQDFLVRQQHRHRFYLKYLEVSAASVTKAVRLPRFQLVIFIVRLSIFDQLLVAKAQLVIFFPGTRCDTLRFLRELFHSHLDDGLFCECTCWHQVSYSVKREV